MGQALSAQRVMCDGEGEWREKEQKCEVLFKVTVRNVGGSPISEWIPSVLKPNFSRLYIIYFLVRIGG